MGRVVKGFTDNIETLGGRYEVVDNVDVDIRDGGAVVWLEVVPYLPWEDAQNGKHFIVGHGSMSVSAGLEDFEQ